MSLSRSLGRLFAGGTGWPGDSVFPCSESAWRLMVQRAGGLGPMVAALNTDRRKGWVCAPLSLLLRLLIKWRYSTSSSPSFRSQMWHSIAFLRTYFYWSVVDLQCCVNFHGNNKVNLLIHIHISTLSQFLSHMDPYRGLSRAPCAIL